MIAYCYKNPRGDLFTRTIADTADGVMRLYFGFCDNPSIERIRDRFEDAKARGGRIVEVEIRETGR